MLKEAWMLATLENCYVNNQVIFIKQELLDQHERLSRQVVKAGQLEGA